MNGAAVTDFEASVREFELLLDCLAGDVRALEVASEWPPPQPSRRTYCRAVFALVDGLTFNLKQLVLEWFEGELEEEDIAKLREFHELHDDSGTCRRRRRFLPLSENVFYAVDMFSLMHGVSNPIDRSGKEWSTFIDAISVRNRITHPKNSSALEITDTDLSHVIAAGRWVVQTYETLHTDIANSLPDQAKALEAARDRLASRGPKEDNDIGRLT